MNLNNVIQEWLRDRKISLEVQNDFGITGVDNIIIPVHDIDGSVLYNKYRRSPLAESGAKYWYDAGGHVELYGWWKAKEKDTIVITEGEFDCLVCWSHNIPAVTSTGGAMSFQESWADLLRGKDVIICLDNDQAGAKGTVKILEMLPNSKVVMLPKGIKDISEYVIRGGDLRELIATARGFSGIEEVQADRSSRHAVFEDHFFHDEYIKTHTKVEVKGVKHKGVSSDRITRAKEYPLPDIYKFVRNKAVCPFHNDKDASLHYYPEDNHAFCFGCSKVVDSIDLYRAVHGCSFVEAVRELNK